MARADDDVGAEADAIERGTATARSRAGAHRRLEPRDPAVANDSTGAIAPVDGAPFDGAASAESDHDTSAQNDRLVGRAGTGTGETARRPRVALFATVAAAVLGVDVVSKALVVADVNPLLPKRLLGGAVYLVLARNGGAAFSIGPSATVVFTAVAVFVVAVLVRVAGRLRSAAWAIALGLVLGGALGNLVDRLARAPGVGRGHVVDWISLFADDGHVWPIFNLADSAIVCGGVLGATLVLFGVDFSGRRTAHGDRSDTAPGKTPESTTSPSTTSPSTTSPSTTSPSTPRR